MPSSEREELLERGRISLVHAFRRRSMMVVALLPPLLDEEDVVMVMINDHACGE